MGIINVLDFKVANLIAAGEVVDRPASVVKELLENAIDSGANNITIEIKNGGISFIRVSDNGKGMLKDDVSLSLKRHATSKIKNASDLDGILTLGFRGEALAAISSVSKVRIMTKPPKEFVGTLLTSVAGDIQEITETGCQEGTTVIVEELFYNVPARRKFLKKDISEANAIGAVVEKISLSKAGVAFKYINDGNLKFSTAGDGKLINTIYAVLGKEFSKKLSEINYLSEGIEIKGYIGRPDNVRSNRNFQNFFINGRYVKNLTSMAALEQAFNSFIPSDKFPCCVLFINIHPAYVDVNVHPAKLEVKFSNEKIVFDAIYAAVRSTLQQKLVRPQIEIAAKTKVDIDEETVEKVDSFLSIYDKLNNENDEKDKNIKATVNKRQYSTDSFKSQNEPKPINPPNVSYEPILKKPMPELISSEREQSSVKSVKFEEKNQEFPLPNYKIIGDAFGLYIFLVLEDRVLIIDKHAAHERILFEDLKRNLTLKNVYSQLLIMPIEYNLSIEEYSALSEYKEDIFAIGFDITFDDNSHNVTVYQIPSNIKIEIVSDIIETIANRLANNTGNVEISRDIIFEKALYQAACKSAVKAGTTDSASDIQWICEKLLQLPDIKFCPHGRPVAFELTKNEMEKQFKRI